MPKRGERKNMSTEKLNTSMISVDTIQQMASAIAIRGLKTTLAKSANEKIAEMLTDAIHYAKSPMEWQGDDGADIIQDVALFLSEYIGNELTDTTTDGQKDKDGNPITILRGAFRVVRRTIYGHEQRQFKQVYIEDYEKENGIIAIPENWDIPDFGTWDDTTTIIDGLELTPTQMQVLNYRMQGLSNKAIAKIRGTDAANIGRRLAKIGEKYIAVYGEIPMWKMTIATK